MSAASRQRRAAIAERLMAIAPQVAASLDWDALGRAPAWLALPDAGLATFQCRVGAVLCGSALRLWIDRGRLAAAQAVLGAPFLRKLLAEPDEASIPIGLVTCPEIDSPTQVEPVLRLAGASVLLASLPSGVLREAVAAVLAPVTPSTMAHELAVMLVARAGSIEASAAEPVAVHDTALALAGAAA